MKTTVRISNVSVLSFKIFFINLERAIYTFLWAELVGPKLKLKQGAVLDLFCFTNPEKKHDSLEIQSKE